MTSDGLAATHPLRYPGAWVQAGVGGTLLLVLGVLVADTHAPGPVDTLLSGAVSRASPWPAVALAVDWLGEPVGALLVAATLSAVLLVARRPRFVVVLVASQASVLVLGDALKIAVGRTIHEGSPSYPSGHTAGAVAFALVLGLFLADVGGLRGGVEAVAVLALGLVAALVAGWAQVVLDAHYPTDTVGGLFLGVAVVPVWAQVVDGVADRRRGRVPPDSLGPR
ncbi:phosphatase PAP2 family protein [Pseudonocardia pini]|uniref:phosphatase PAP2 family protein n=1 Tax=Pseudonocardia pini TaxID=2758030 RepID=UPI0015F06036|nr:phosphatase PAP2 family protein [Pseudonocardia pini]